MSSNAQSKPKKASWLERAIHRHRSPSPRPPLTSSASSSSAGPSQIGTSSLVVQQSTSLVDSTRTGSSTTSIPLQPLQAPQTQTRESSGVANSALVVPQTGGIPLIQTPDATPQSVNPTLISQDVTNSTQSPQKSDAFKLALVKVLEELNAEEKVQFQKAYQNISLDQAISTIKRLDDDNSTGKSRRVASKLEPAIRVLDQFMNGVSIGIQQSPEISSLVVGALRVTIDLVGKYVEFHKKLSEMIIFLGNYLAPVNEFDQNTLRGGILERALVNVYADLLKFFREARLVFVDTENKLKRLGAFRTFCRVQWEPFEDKFGEIKSTFVEHVDLLITSAQAQQLSILNDQSKTLGHLKVGIDDAGTARHQGEVKEQIEERRTFLNWISTIDHESDFEGLIKLRHPETGKWLLEHQSFQKWVSREGSSLLWCRGHPGAGKSVLASVVVNEATKYELMDEKCVVIFAYFSYRDPERDAPESLIGAFLKQLCSKLKHLPDPVKGFFRRTYNDGKTMKAEEMKQLLFGLLQSYKRVFIIIDALDECQASTQSQVPGRRPKYRAEIVKLIHELTTDPSICAKIFLTSRNEADIQIQLESCPTIQIDVDQVNADIKTYLQDEIEKRIKGRRLVLDDMNLKAVILETLSTKAEGMFLWAALQLDWICEQMGDDDIKAELTRLPADLNATYDQILERINKRPPRQQELAKRALMWVLYAERPLYIQELGEASAIEPSMKTIEATQKSCPDSKTKALQKVSRDAKTIMLCTGNLLTLDESNRVRLIHTSVKDYLTAPGSLQCSATISKYFTSRKDAHMQLALSCMKYLQLEDWLWIQNYSAYYFDKHIEKLEGLPPEIVEELERVLNLLEGDVYLTILRLRRRKGALNFDVQSFEQSYSKPEEEPPVISIIYSSSLYSIFSRYMPGCKWLEQAPPKYSLHQACIHGEDDAILRLLAITDEVNEFDGSRRSPLCHAAVQGHLSSVRILLEHGADPNLNKNGKHAALCNASAKGHLAIVELLLKHGADVNLGSCFYARTPLQTAACYGHLAVVALLLKHHPHPQKITESLIEACNFSCKPDKVAQLLLENGAQATQAALEEASKWGWYNRCKMMLDRGVEVRAEALLQACRGACKTDEVAQLLLNNGAQATEAALEEASKWGWYKRCKILLDRDARITDTAFLNACSEWCRTDDVAQLLLDSGAQATEAALNEASKHGFHNRCKMMLDRNVKITAKGFLNAFSPENEDDSVAMLFVGHGASATEALNLLVLRRGKYRDWDDSSHLKLLELCAKQAADGKGAVARSEVEDEGLDTLFG